MRNPATRGKAGALAAALLMVAAGSSAADVRALHASGRALTVGNWKWVLHEGRLMKATTSDVLSWELRDGARLVLQGEVPGTNDGRADTGAVLSRNPATGALLVAWSREAPSGFREIVTLPFADNAWLIDRFTILAPADGANHVDPSLAHDGAGHAWIAWRVLDSQRRIRLQVRDVDGEIAMNQGLSEGLSIANGAPAIALDGLGRPVAAFFGEDTADGVRRIHLMGLPELGSGLIHVPNPIIELAVSTAEPASASFDSGIAAGRNPTQLHVDVIGTRTVAWWVRQDADGNWLFEHLAQDVEGTWDGSSIGAIATGAGTGEPVAEALGTLRTHLRVATLEDLSVPLAAEATGPARIERAPRR